MILSFVFSILNFKFEYLFFKSTVRYEFYLVTKTRDLVYRKQKFDWFNIKSSIKRK